MTDQLTVSVVIACYTEDRWPHLVAAVNSAAAQSRPPIEVLVVCDHNDALSDRVRRAWPEVTVLRNEQERGASGARNTGVRHATGDLVAFLDDDAAASSGWLEKLVEPFEDDTVVGVGGGVTPTWAAGVRPSWFPPEFDWVIGASYHGMPTVTSPTRNVWAENMAVRRMQFEYVSGFRSGFGKQGNTSRPEDTELCIRLAASVPGGRWMYVPDARVSHWVPADRSTFAFFVRRTFAEGRGKAELRDISGADEALSSERDYLRKVVPLAFVAGLRPPFRMARSFSIVAGVISAGLGYAYSRIHP